jgi:hypothetical protein
MWKEIAFGATSRVAANVSSLKGRPVWLIANGASVSDFNRRH